MRGVRVCLIEKTLEVLIGVEVEACAEVDAVHEGVRLRIPFRHRVRLGSVEADLHWFTRRVQTIGSEVHCSLPAPLWLITTHGRKRTACPVRNVVTPGRPQLKPSPEFIRRRAAMVVHVRRIRLGSGVAQVNILAAFAESHGTTLLAHGKTLHRQDMQFLNSLRKRILRENS